MAVEVRDLGFFPPSTVLPEPARETSELAARGPSLTIWIALLVLLLLAGGISAAWFIRDPEQ
ncbi:MAG TPA: hypothetical protein VIV15_10005 [Anaerolineales bacterium]